ncbi:MAG: GNAT family N-acetyltransferase [Acidiferrobacterales bacterium]
MNDLDTRVVIRFLHDRTPVLIRPLVASDKAGLRTGFKRLSERSRYHRFFTPMKALSEAMLERLTDIDYRRHMAWVALDISRLPAIGVGVVRYVALEDRPGVAEMALTIVDSHHGRGLGATLLAVLSDSAAANNFSRFEGNVLAENEGMVKLLRRRGATLKLDGPGVFHFTMPVHSQQSSFPYDARRSLDEHCLPASQFLVA